MEPVLTFPPELLLRAQPVKVLLLDVGLPQGISDAVEGWTAEWLGYGFFIDRLDIVAALVAAALVAGALALACHAWPYKLGLMAAALSGIAIGVALERRESPATVEEGAQ